ncbi:TetR/AcrR family transcriptional regulator [Paraburkholderia sp.]|uniref:TetR/AcrR family transcriptional regulator n=1 Tax=Paraburkholderia sp. TaxID=1926495 RepID=UPI003D6F9E7F
MVGADALLRSAREAFARQGFEATSIRDIARRCGVDSALIAHHFGTKEGLWMAVVMQIVSEIAPMNEKATKLRDRTELTPRARFEKGIALLVDQVFLSPDVGMFFSTAATERGDRLDALTEHLMRPFYGAFVPLMKDLIATGEIGKQDPYVALSLLVNGIGKTVAYSDVILPFTSLPKRPAAFKAAVLAAALRLLR